jgi:uncharacterized membrane protein YdjX (TVP38/TMEM64 family)
MKRSILYNNIDGNSNHRSFQQQHQSSQLQQQQNQTSQQQQQQQQQKTMSYEVDHHHNPLDNVTDLSTIVTPITGSISIQQQPQQLVQTQQQYQLHHIKHILSSSLDAKKIISSIVFTFLFLLICDSMFSQPEVRIIQPNFANHFLLWVQDHPSTGMIWILLVMSIAVICMIPIGTPLTLGCGYIYKGAYGWKVGILIATIVSMLGSALGAVICFLLGRYMMRTTVKRWIRKYPIFDAIDIAASEHGLRIMAMLYLTPILPLGPVSYMCGTTSLKLSHFIIAKIAALPLMLLYVIIGASTGTLISSSNSNNNNNNTNVQSIEDNETLIISGIVLSFASIAGITHYIKKELNHILERQKRQLENKDDIEITTTSNNNNNTSSLLLSPISDHTTPKKNMSDIETTMPISTTTNDGTIIMIENNHHTPITSTNTNNTIIETSTIIPTTATRQRKH